MKKLILILFIFCFGKVFGQPIVNRSNASVTVSDARLQGGLNLLVPRFADTTAANVQKGIDSCGAIIFTYDVQDFWKRVCYPVKHWERVSGNSNVLVPQCGLGSGGTVTWDSLLVFDVSAAYWVSCCDNIPRQTTFTVVTLAAADPSLPRIDAIVLDPTTGVTVVEGTEAADPAIPDISPCQVFLTAVLIQAGSTVPSGIGQATVYDENNGGEWIPATVTGVTADFVNTTSPAHLLKAIHWVSGATGTRQIVFNAPDEININDYGILKLYIKLTTGIFGGYLMVDFPGSTSFGIPLSSFGFVPSSAVGYQIISIPLNAFTFTNPTTVDQFRILVKGTTTTALDFYVDWVQFQSGINTPSSQTGIVNVNVTGNHLFNPVLTYPFANTVNIAFPLDGFLPVNLLDTADGNDGDLIKKVNGVWTPYPDSLVIDTVFTTNWVNSSLGPLFDTVYWGARATGGSLLSFNTFLGVNSKTVHFQQGTRDVLFLNSSGFGASNGILPTSGAAADSVLKYRTSDGQFYLGIGSTYVTADNGLTDSSGRVILGGSLYKNTTINTPGFGLTLTGSVSGNPVLNVINSNSSAGSSVAIRGTAQSGSGSNAIEGLSDTQSGVYGFSTSGYGVYAESIGGRGLVAVSNNGSNVAIHELSLAASTNTVIEINKIERLTTGTAANGIGVFNGFYIEDAGGSSNLSNQLISKWTDAANATRTSQFIITGINSAVAKDLATFSSEAGLVLNGSLTLPYTAQTGTYQILATDYTINCTANTFTVTLPTAVGISGRIYFITNSGAGTITLATTSSQTFANVVATPTTLPIATLTGVTVQSNGANWLKVSSF